ncbi:MAG TPA: fatty acyl-AMP ligase [Ktedonobacteraceae bacterium]
MRSVLASPVQQGDSLIHCLQRRSVEQPERLAYTFLRFGGENHETLTYAQLDRRARAISVHLRLRGTEGRPVLLLFPSSLEYIAAYFGCLYAGAIAVPAYVPHSARDLPRIEAIAVDAGAELALTTTRARSRVTRWLERVPALAHLHWLASDEMEAEDPGSWPGRTVAGSDLAFLQYTSGSTAAPRGVMVSHGNLMQNLATIHAFWRVEDIVNPVSVSWLPIFHDMGLIMGILSPLYSGYPAYVLSPTDFLQCPLRWLQAIARYRGTFSSAPNFAYELCVQRISPEDASSLDLSCWRGAGNAAEPVRVDTLAHFLRHFSACGFAPDAFRPAYGLAEATLVVTGQYRGEPIYVQPVGKRRLEEGVVEITAGPAPEIKRLVGCGRPIHGQQIAIVDPQTHRPCLPDRVGEIWVRGPAVTLGYWKRPRETAEVFQAYLATGEGPFLRTGDLGIVQHGHLLITGRLKDVMILDGRHLFPQDIEQTVERAHPALRPGLCVAFSCELAGQERLIVLAEIHHRYRAPAQEPPASVSASAEPVDLRAILRSVRRVVSEQHGVRVHEVLLLRTGGILRTSSGKLQRQACCQAFLQGTLKTWQGERADQRP